MYYEIQNKFFKKNVEAVYSETKFHIIDTYEVWMYLDVYKELLTSQTSPFVHKTRLNTSPYSVRWSDDSWKIS
jgi:hypothetical protein